MEADVAVTSMGEIVQDVWHFDATQRLIMILLGAPGIATRSKDATRDSWPYY